MSVQYCFKKSLLAHQKWENKLKFSVYLNKIKIISELYLL